MPSQSSAYKTIIEGIIGAITFDGGTLSSKGLIYKYEKSKTDANTEINIFRTKLVSSALDNATNIRKHYILISIIARTENREEQAQEDIDYLEEQITEKMEKNMGNVNWMYLDNTLIEGRERNFESNYFVKDIPIQINEDPAPIY